MEQYLHGVRDQVTSGGAKGRQGAICGIPGPLGKIEGSRGR